MISCVNDWKGQLNAIMQSNLKYRDVTQKIIGCAITVLKKMGSCYNKLIYSRCFAIEFDKAGLNYKKELEWPVYYDDFIVGKRRVDFMVEDKISLEIKATHELTNKELAQALNYLESFKLEIGLLINFGSPSLQFKRLINEQRLSKEINPVNPISNPESPRL